MKLVALKQLKIFQQPVAAGQAFEIPCKEGRTLKALGWAAEQAEMPRTPRRRGPYKRRDMQAEATPSVEVPPTVEVPPRQEDDTSS